MTRDRLRTVFLFETLAIALRRGKNRQMPVGAFFPRYLGTTQLLKKDPPRDKRDGPEKKHNQLLQAGEPSINLFAGLIFGIAVTLL